MKKNLLLMMALTMAITGMTACGTKEVEKASEPQTLPIEVKEDEVVDYYEPQEEKAGLVPPIPLRLKGVSFEGVTLNTTAFHFAEATPDELLEVSGTAIDESDVKDIENDDFCFHGFAARSGGNTMFYVEFTKDGELVENFIENDMKNYEIKGIWTSAELLDNNTTYLSCGSRIFIGLQKYDIEMINGKGYTSSFDENMLYYPDVAGWTLGLLYADGTYVNETPNETEKGTAEATESAEISAVPDGVSEKYLSEIYIFKGDAKIAEAGE